MANRCLLTPNASSRLVILGWGWPRRERKELQSVPVRRRRSPFFGWVQSGAHPKNGGQRQRRALAASSRLSLGELVRIRVRTVEPISNRLSTATHSSPTISVEPSAEISPRMRLMATTAAPVSDQTIVEFDVRTDEMLVNMGPQHPSTHGVLRLVLRTDGEVISEVTPHLGYLHRCAEKIGENVTPIQFIPYTDRMDYLAGMNMNLAYSMAVEKLCGMKIPGKGAGHPRHHRGDEPHRQPPRRHGRLWPRPRHIQPVFVRLPRTRDDSRPVRGSVRRPADVQLSHHRRRPRRLAGRLGGTLPGLPRLPQTASGRVSHSSDPQSHLRPAHGQHRRHVEGNGVELRLHGADAARLARPLEGRSRLGFARTSLIAATKLTISRSIIPPFPEAPPGTGRSATAGIASTCACWNWWKASRSSSRG